MLIKCGGGRGGGEWTVEDHGSYIRILDVFIKF